MCSKHVVWGSLGFIFFFFLDNPVNSFVNVRLLKSFPLLWKSSPHLCCSGSVSGYAWRGILAGVTLTGNCFDVRCVWCEHQRIFVKYKVWTAPSIGIFKDNLSSQGMSLEIYVSWYEFPVICVISNLCISYLNAFSSCNSPNSEFALSLLLTYLCALFDLVPDHRKTRLEIIISAVISPALWKFSLIHGCVKWSLIIYRELLNYSFFK